MHAALGLAARGLGNVWPNPAVGCVIVRDGRVAGRGFTRPGGRPHAETEALAAAGEAARGATAYVTLEPCAHHGRTPPCADALAGAGIARVVSAIEDPDPRVSGRGHQMLRDRGVTVETGLLADRARELQKGFLTRVQKGRPMLTLKLAVTLDGRIATASGESRWITGPQARRAVHGLRSCHDAVMVGGGTARADDPMLTVRGFGAVRQPVRIVVSATLNLSPASALARSVRQAPLWIVHGSVAVTQPWTGRGVRLFEVPTAGGAVDAAAMMGALGGAGLTRVLCEGGSRLAATLLQAGLVDELVVISAGRVLGADAVGAAGPLAVGALAEAPRFVLADVVRTGEDLLHRWVAAR
jgi:diaminohydroxyphosphoribosylaminopyrimidine deaminase/5-amino-6-(5-phosphoribosylamino)uracil reductase